jgi:hypothetical protein
MSTSRLLKMFASGAIAIMGIMQMNPVFAALPTSVDAGDVQHFEQTYEEWVQSLAASIAPNIPTTVLVDLEYSNNPEDLQNYEELKAANHLPGLPDITDPHFTYPSESPLYSLIAKQRVKLIFESELNANQQKVLEEVLNNKLKLNKDRGDSVNIEHINTVSAPVQANKPAAKSVDFSKIKLSKKQSVALIGLALLGILGLTVRRKQFAIKKVIRTLTTRKAKETNTEIEYIRVVPTEKSVTQKLSRKHPRLFARTSLIVNPLNIVLKANPKVLVSVVRNENTANLARATLHAPEMFTGILLNICTQDQKNQIRGIWHVERNSITPEQSRFAQVLLAARIFRQLKKQKDVSIDPVIGEYANAKRAKQALRNRMNLQLSELKASLKNANSNSNLKTTDTQSEASL